MDTKKLKQKILDLAVRGKLVPQDPSDEPASVLLERIRTEKEQLIKEKKIKRDKNESHIYRSGKSYYEKRGSETVCIDDEIPFEIPASWEWCRFGVVSNYGECNTTKASDIKATDWILDLEDIEKDSGRIVKRVTQQEKQSLSNKHSFSAGQLLYSKLRPYLNKVVIAAEDGYCTTEIIPINFNGWVLPKYGQIFIMSYYFLTYANMLSYGVKMPRMGTSDGRKVLFPLAPISEQIRIISQVESLLSLVDNVDNNKVDLQIIIQQTKAKVLDLAIRGKLVPQDPTDEPASVLLKRIKAEKEATAKPTKRGAKTATTTSDNSHYPYEIPESWIWCCFGDTNDYGKCQSVKPTDIELDDWILDLEDIEKNTGKVIAYNTYQTRSSASNKYKFSKGQLLYSKLRPYLNKVTIAQFDGYCTSEIIPINFKGYVVPRYGQIFLMSNYFLEYANMLSYGVKMPRMGTNDAKKARFPLPPLNEQKRIGAKVDEIFKQLDNIEKALIE